MTFISNHKKFIFLHIPKNAGTSIKNALANHLKNELELLPKSKIRLVDKYVNSFLHHTARRGIYLPCSKLKNKYYKKQTHLSYADLEDSWKNFSEYKIFCFVRNPFSRQVSLYNYMKKSSHFKNHVTRNMNFEEYIQWRCQKDNLATQSMFIKSKDGKIKIKKIFKLEELSTNWLQIMTWLELPKLELKKLNTTSNDLNSYKSYFNEELTKLIVRNFSEDFENFNYKKSL